MSKPTERILPELIQDFFTQRLQTQQHVSVNTLASYRDTIRLLLLFVEGKTGCSPSQQRLAHWDAPQILAFLDYLEQERQCQVRSRNARLAGLRPSCAIPPSKNPWPWPWLIACWPSR